jgi:hypothetical protein
LEKPDFTLLPFTEATTITFGSSVGRLRQSSPIVRWAGVESFGLVSSPDLAARLYFSLPAAATLTTPLLSAYATERRTASAIASWSGSLGQVNSHGSV